MSKNLISPNKKLLADRETFVEIDSLFIGGGPSTLGVLTNANQTGRLEELVMSGATATGKGFAIVEMTDQFGGGNLQKHFGIRSNTSATGFLKVIMYPKTKPASPTKAPQSACATGQAASQAALGMIGNCENRNKSIFYQHSLNKTSNFGQKSQAKFNAAQSAVDDKRKFLPQFSEFGESDLVKSLQKYGKKVAPLQLIGTFLSFAGNQILNDIHNRFQKKVFFGNHKVNKIQQFERNAEQYWIIEAVNLKNPKLKVIFKSRNVILATGAKQIVPPAFRDQFSLGAATKVFTSDQILKNNVFSEVVKTIRSRKGKAKITILGGSHSAFSIVFLLLNGACPIPSFDDIARKQRQVRKSNSSHMVQSKQAQGDRKPAANGVKLSLCKSCVCCPYGLSHSTH